MALYEIRQRREIEELRPFYWRGIRTFITSTSGISDAHNMQGDDFPGTFPSLAAGVSWWGLAGPIAASPPQCSKTRIIYDPGGVVDLAMVFAFYESTGVGFGRLHTKDVSERFKRMFVAGKEGVYDGGPPITSVVEGFEQDGVHEWQVVKGSNVVTRTHSILRVDTSYGAGDVPYTTMHSHWDCVSDDEVKLPGITAIAAGKLWFMGAITSRERFGGITDVSYFFAYSAAGWANECQVRRGVWVPIQQPVHDAAEALLVPATTRTKLVYMPGKQLNTVTGAIEASAATAARKVRPVESMTDFGLNGLTAW